MHCWFMIRNFHILSKQDFCINTVNSEATIHKGFGRPVVIKMCVRTWLDLSASKCMFLVLLSFQHPPAWARRGEGLWANILYSEMSCRWQKSNDSLFLHVHLPYFLFLQGSLFWSFPWSSSTALSLHLSQITNDWHFAHFMGSLNGQGQFLAEILKNSLVLKAYTVSALRPRSSR